MGVRDDNASTLESPNLIRTSLEELERRIWQGLPDRPSGETTCRRLTDGNMLAVLVPKPYQHPLIDKVLGRVEDERFGALLRQDRSEMQEILMEKR